MEMLPPGAETLAREKVRPLKRVEFDHLAASGYFDNERVELLFGMVVEMSPISSEHDESVTRVYRRVLARVGDRADVRSQVGYAASDDSEPQPDVIVIPNGDYWHRHPDHAFLVIEVSRSSLPRDRGAKRVIYAGASVDEYWIVNHEERVVEVYREPKDGTWRSVTTFTTGQHVAMLRFPDVTIAVDEILPPR